MYSVGLMGRRLPPPALDAFCSALRRLCHAMKPQEQANSLLGLAYMFKKGQVASSTAMLPPCVEAAAVEVLRAAQPRLTSGYTDQELSNLAWAFSKVGSRSPPSPHYCSVVVSPQQPSACSAVQPNQLCKALCSHKKANCWSDFDLG
jgi:hypothetical protein